MIFSYIKQLIKPKKKNMIIAIGDVHGKLSKLVEALEKFKDDPAIDFVQLGDFGLGFDNPIKEYKRLKDINFILSKNNHRMWVIRGNHDNPCYWGKGSSMELSQISFVKDGTVMELNGKKCFFSGGAISIDRTNRIKGVSYWENEKYKWVDVEKPDNIDYVFTHDVYHQCSPFNVYSERTKYWFERDQNLRQDLIDSQEKMEKLHEWLVSINPNFSWYHGHYHESTFTTIENQKTYCLSELEFKEVI